MATRQGTVSKGFVWISPVRMKYSRTAAVENTLLNETRTLYRSEYTTCTISIDYFISTALARPFSLKITEQSELYITLR